MLKLELVQHIVIINEVARVMTKGEYTYVHMGQTLYPLHNFVVRGDNKLLKVVLAVAVTMIKLCDSGC